MNREFLKALLVLVSLLGALFGAAASKKAAAAQAGQSREPQSWLKGRLWTTAKYFAAFLMVMAIGGFLVSASGIIPIKASSGHWAITRWFLNFSSQRSVSTHTLGMTAPPLDNLNLVLKGSGAYEMNCRPCHGNPSVTKPTVAQGMTPTPPYLPNVVPLWDSEELFYIVKHGIKFTGMPAWPSQQRDDEVWAMVAFLRKLPDMSAEQYQRLVYGEKPVKDLEAPMRNMMPPEEAPRAIQQTCGRCHGADGLGRGEGAFPRLAGQRPAYLYAALRAYFGGHRDSGIMEPVAAGLTDAEMRELTDFYGGLTDAPLPSTPLDAQAVQRGRKIAMEGIPSQRVPPCSECHGPAGHTRNPVFPELAGQYPAYLVQQLKLFQQRTRGGTPYVDLMYHVAAGLSEEQMRDAAAYFASLPPVSDPPLAASTDESAIP